MNIKEVSKMLDLMIKNEGKEITEKEVRDYDAQFFLDNLNFFLEGFNAKN